MNRHLLPFILIAAIAAPAVAHADGKVKALPSIRGPRAAYVRDRVATYLRTDPKNVVVYRTTNEGGRGRPRYYFIFGPLHRTGYVDADVRAGDYKSWGGVRMYGEQDMGRNWYEGPHIGEPDKDAEAQGHQGFREAMGRILDYDPANH